MPRKPRLFLPDQPQHVVVRGHNREQIMSRIEDFRFMYRVLRDAMSNRAVSVHAWVLMHNNLHLLVTPERIDSLPKAMQSIGRRYAQYFNRCYQRSGSLWEGRYKSALVDGDDYLLSCYRYIELNPVRAGIIRHPADYAYSSYHANALGKPDSLVTEHPVFKTFIQPNRSVYQDLCQQSLNRKVLNTIRRGTEKGLGIGQAEFLLKVARLSG